MRLSRSLGVSINVVEETKQHVGITAIKSLEVGITTTQVETIVASIMEVVKKGVLIGHVTN
jgi:hypothetical protein